MPILRIGRRGEAAAEIFRAVMPNFDVSIPHFDALIPNFIRKILISPQIPCFKVKNSK
jgi:hypothetical protein